MNLDTIVQGLLALGLVAFAFVFLLQRADWARRRKQGKTGGFRPSVAALGNAFQVLQVIAQPRVQYVLEEKLDESAEDEGDGGPDDPVRHLLWQAERIRRGGKVGRLTALLASKEEHRE